MKGFRKTFQIILSLLGLAFISLPSAGQQSDTLSLPACFRLATERFPLIAGKSLLQEEMVLEDENLKSAYYPQMDVGAQATYFSDVVTINLDPSIPGVTFPKPYHDQYAVTLDVHQMIYDGGAVKNRRTVKEQSLGLRQQDLEVKLYAFKQKLAHIFFSALFLDDNYAILQQNLRQMEKSLAEAETALRHGALLSGDVNILKAARLDIRQKMAVNRHDRRAVTRLLGMYLDTTFSDRLVLSVPPPAAEEGTALRPEMQLFAMQHSWLEASRQLQRTQRRPVISAFGQVGYGRPGLNPLNLDFKGFYFVGARLSWNLWDWNRTGRQKKILSYEQQLVSQQQELFSRQVSADLIRIREEIEKLQEIIVLDHKRMLLREGIVREYAGKLAAGTVTPAEYERQFTAWQNAQIQLNLHRKQLLEKQIEQLVTQGNLNDYEKEQ